MAMKPMVFTLAFTICSTSALAIKSSFCVVLNTHFFCSVIGNTTAAVPTGASIGTPASATNGITPTELGEPLGPMMASTLYSEISFFTSVTERLGSLPSSREIYSMVRSTTLVGNNGTVFFCGMPTREIGPVDDVTTPTLICACATVAMETAVSASEAAIKRLTNIVIFSVNE